MKGGGRKNFWGKARKEEGRVCWEKQRRKGKGRIGENKEKEAILKEGRREGIGEWKKRRLEEIQGRTISKKWIFLHFNPC